MDGMQKSARLAIPFLALIMAAAGVAAVILPASHAVHEDEGNSRYFWDRSTASGHRDLLNCQQDDRCKIPFEIYRNLANVNTKPGMGMSVYAVGSEVVRAANTVNRAVEYMGVQSVPDSINTIQSKTLPSRMNAIYDNPRHCVAWFGVCIGDYHGRDDHIAKFTIYVNSNRQVVFGTVEECSGNRVLVRDIEKTIAHELWHIMGSEHSSQRSSIVNPDYSCRTGEVPNAHDKALMRDKYPREVR